MNVRSFDWRDLPALHRYRKQGLFLDSTLLLTRRPSLMPTGALLNYFSPTTGIFTYVCEDEHIDGPLIGQVTHTAGIQSARLSFLAPERFLQEEKIVLDPLIELMAVEVANRGGMFILAEAYDGHPAFELLRRVGFAIYARQRFWQLNVPPSVSRSKNIWRSCSEQDILSIRLLYNNLVPGLVQQVEPLPSHCPKGMVCEKDGDLIGFIELKYGPKGILAQPFIHPDAKELPSELVPLLESLPDRGSRPVYLCVRTYQSWLETALYDADVQPSPLSAVMVKRLVVSHREEQSYTIPALDSTRVEPIARIKKI